ncbi:MAG TPA: hypothetical protein DDW52_06190, partial [Planctomycetaceae bacterium]|nr:hypothetical protein [Planctomycetaceae bacterium]
ARASWVQFNLEDYFEEAGDDDDWRFRFFYGFDQPKQDDKRELGKRPPLRFIADNDTNSIVVIGADDKDRDTIRELIELWDVPEPESEIDDSRYIQLVKIQYSTAETIANTLKEAFRDLLSANDKAFQDGDEESKRDGGGDDGGFSFAYKGKLSLGVDPITNTILVNAEGRVLSELIIGTIKDLDEQAKTENEVGVYKMPATVNGKDVAETLKRLLSKPKQPDKNQQQQQQQ